MLLILAALGVLLLAWMIFIDRKRRWAKQKAESRLKEFRNLLANRSQSLQQMTNQAELIEQSTLHTTGATQQLAEAAVKAGQGLEKKYAPAHSAIDKAESLIYPDNSEAKLKNFFFSDGYQDAIYLLDEESANLPSDLECSETARLISLNSKQIADSFESLNHLSRFAASDLEKSARRVSQLVKLSYSDGFFPMINLRTKLIPSLETMLDETNRVGATDPITAVSNPAKLASQQLTNLKLIIDAVDQIRNTVCPTVSSAVSRIEKTSSFPDWINREFLNHSRNIESISNHAVLWSVDERLDRLQNELDHSKQRILGIGHLSEQLTDSTEPELERLDTLISQARWEVAQSIHPKPDQILREGHLDPSHKVELARHSLSLIKNSANHGQKRNLDDDLDGIHQLINEGYEILRVGKNVASRGEHYWQQISKRASTLNRALASTAAQIQQLEQNYHPEVLLTTSRLGNESNDNTSLSALNDRSEKLFPECQSLLNAAQVSFRKGNLLTTGWQLERAAIKLETAENNVSIIGEQVEAANEASTSNRKLIGDVRWRHRTLLAKVDDHSTRSRTIERHKNIQQMVQRIESELGNPSNNPFSIAESLSHCQDELQRLEENINVDKLWHGLATESVKSAARSLRLHRTYLEEFNGDNETNQRKISSAGQTIDRLKEKLAKWQEFLEQPHHDWKDAFDGGINIDTESSEAIHAFREDAKSSREAAVLIRRAGQQITYLMNWQNTEGIELKRESGICKFDEARSAYAHGKIESAINLAQVANDQAEAALTTATARSKRSKTRTMLQQKGTEKESLTPGFELSREIAQLMVSPLTAGLAFDDQCGFPKSATPVDQPIDSTTSVLTDSTRQTLPLKYSTQRERDQLRTKIANH